MIIGNIIHVGKALQGGLFAYLYSLYKKRVETDSGTINSVQLTSDAIRFFKQNNLYDSTLFGWMAGAGSKKRTVVSVNTPFGFFPKLYSLVTPTPRYGSELVTNGTFDTTSNWTTGSYWSISNGKANYVNTGLSGLTQNITLVVGKLYKITIDFAANTNAQFSFYNQSAGWLFSEHQSTKTVITGRYEYFGTALSTNALVIFGYSTGDSFSIDNISIQEVLNSVYTVTDATQTTEASQPRVTGNIAPNDIEALQNQNGEARFMTHPTISFAANEAWSLSMVIEYNSDNTTTHSLINNTVNDSYIQLNFGGYKYRIINSTPAQVSGVLNKPLKLIGKTSVLTFVAAGNGTILIYANGVLDDTITIASNFNFSKFLSTPLNLKSHIIRNVALTASEVLTEATFLRTKYPEIPSVTIGSQTWSLRNFDAVSTVQGNPIANITENANVEKITVAADREFSSDTGFWTKSTNVLINNLSSGLCTFNSVANVEGIKRNNLLTVGKWYKYSFTIVSFTSGLGVRGLAGTNVGAAITAVGSHIQYIQSDGVIGGVVCFGTTVAEIDNVSIQEVGWSDSQNLYDFIYAQTAGTAEAKTYAAVKAAAMWSFYNNSADNGAIYGKLYNWFAVKLLQMDIDYYNAANPTTPWGWRVPTSTDFTDLATALGGASVAGGKMKMTGLNYWNTPNTGADNSSGFTALGGGRRLGTTGVSQLLKNYSIYFGVSADTAVIATINSDDAVLLTGTQDKNFGNSLRLIKT